MLYILKRKVVVDFFSHGGAVHYCILFPHISIVNNSCVSAAKAVKYGSKVADILRENKITFFLVEKYIYVMFDKQEYPIQPYTHQGNTNFGPSSWRQDT